MNVPKFSALVAGGAFACVASSLALAEATPTLQYRVPLNPVAAAGAAKAGDLALSENMLTFANQQADYGQESRSVTLTNSGEFDLTIRAITGVVDDFSVTPNCNNKALRPSKSCTVSVTYRPTGNAGSRGGAYAVSHTGGGADQFIVLGYALKPSVSLVSSLAFDSTPVGSTSSKPLTVTNTGAGPVALASPVVDTGSNYAVTGTTCSSQLGANQSCSYTVAFTPTQRGPAPSSALHLLTGAGTSVIGLSGTGLLGVLGTDSAAGITFADTLVNTAAALRTVKVSNTGTLALDALSIEAPAGFTLRNNSCTTTLAVNSDCTFQLQFRPTEAMDYSGALSLTAARGLMTSVPVTGKGVMPSVTYGNAATATYQVGTGSASGSTLKVLNNGTLPVTVNSMTVSAKTGSFTAAFASGCAAGSVLQAGQTCNIWTSGDGAAGTTHSGTVTVATTGGTLTFNRTFPVVTVNVTYTPMTPSVSGSPLAYQVTMTNPTAVPFQAVQKNTGAVFGGTAPEYGTLSGLESAYFGWQNGNCHNVLVNGSSCSFLLRAEGKFVANRTYRAYLQMLGAFPKADSGVVVGTVPNDNSALWLGPTLISYTTKP